MLKTKRITQMLDIRYPIIQAGMVWTSGGKLAAAAANAGCLGTIGAGSMSPELLKHHIIKAQKLTQSSLAVNIPLLYKGAKEQIDVALAQGIKIFITSAGSPKLYTNYLKENNCKVLHVVSNPLLAKKSEDAGVDIVIAEGLEAGGHNGRDEITTLSLIPQVVDSVSIPVIAAGGIADARAIMATLSLGASGVQLGTRFLMTQESSAHDNFKNLLKTSSFDSTELVMKKLVPVRLFKNDFYSKVKEIEKNSASKEELIALLGKGRAKKGILEGDLKDGELEIGQVCSLIKDIPSVESMVQTLVKDYEKLSKQIEPF